MKARIIRENGCSWDFASVKDAREFVRRSEADEYEDEKVEGNNGLMETVRTWREDSDQ